MYPVLMGADILLFNAHKVPVGRDQIQHIEMARDMAHSFNHRYGEHFVAPQAEIEEAVATLPGLDGRKMSKSYDNTIPLFASRAELQKLIAGIKTDSRLPGEAKDTEGSALFQIYQAFASAEETEALRKHYAQGIAWGEAKQIVFERIDREIAPMRARYQHLIDHPEEVEAMLLAGAKKARAIAMPFMARLRHAVGLRKLFSAAANTQSKTAKAATASFKQYREKDGRFYFKLVGVGGELLLQSLAFESPKVAGQTIAALQTNGAAALGAVMPQLQVIEPDQMDTVRAALTELAQSKTADEK
jgi:tryptophanyl-tRNA synthetase